MKKPKGSGVAIVDSIFNGSTEQEGLSFSGEKSSTYHDSKSSISISDHLSKTTTNCWSERNISLESHEEGILFLFLSTLIVAAAVITVT